MPILVRNLSRKTSEEALSTLFSPYGAVDSCTLVLDKVTGESKGFGFVAMHHRDDADKAIAALNGTHFEDSKIRVKWSNQDEFERNQYAANTPPAEHTNNAEINGKQIWENAAKKHSE